MTRDEKEDRLAAENLRRLEEILMSQFDLSPTIETETSRPPATSTSTQLIKPSTQTSVVEDKQVTLAQSDGKVAFRLFSSQTKPQIINLINTDATGQPSPECIYYPEVSIPIKRILDVDEEPKHIRKTRRNQIKDTVVDFRAIQQLALRIPGPRSQEIRSYRIAKQTVCQEEPKTDSLPSTKRKTLIHSNLAILDALTDPNSSKSSSNPIISKASSKTIKRKKRRQRQNTRSSNDHSLLIEPPKIVKITYL